MYIYRGGRARPRKRLVREHSKRVRERATDACGRKRGEEGVLFTPKSARNRTAVPMADGRPTVRADTAVYATLRGVRRLNSTETAHVATTDERNKPGFIVRCATRINNPNYITPFFHARTSVFYCYFRHFLRADRENVFNVLVLFVFPTRVWEFGTKRKHCAPASS